MMHSMARLIRDHVIRYPDNNDGVIFKGCQDPVAWLARLIGIEPEMMDLFAMGVQILIAEGYLSHSNGTLSIKSFAKYQGSLSPAERQKKSRETRKMSQNVTPVSRDVTSTCHAVSHLEQNRTEQNREDQNTHSGDLTGPLACERAPAAKSQPVKQNSDPIPECVCDPESETPIPTTDLGLGIVLEASGYPDSPPALKPIVESNYVAPVKVNRYDAFYAAPPASDSPVGLLFEAYRSNIGKVGEGAKLDCKRTPIFEQLAQDGETPETVALATRGALTYDWGKQNRASAAAILGSRDQFEKHLAMGRDLCSTPNPDAARLAKADELRRARAKADAEKARAVEAERVRYEAMGYPNAMVFAEADMWREARGVELHRYNPEHECHAKKRKVAG